MRNNNKLSYLIKKNLKKKLKSKWFIVINIILLILLPIICNIDKIVKTFGGDFDKPTNIIVFDNTNEVNELFKKTFSENNKIVLEQSKINISSSHKTIEKEKNAIKKDKNKNIIIELNKSDNIFDASIFSYEYIDSFLYQNILNSLNFTKSTMALTKSNIDINELNKVKKPVFINRKYISEELDENAEFMSKIAPLLIPALIIPLFFLIVMAVNMIGAEINDEKSSKSMEIIISSISAKTHFLSKMISINVFVMLQGLLLLIYGFLGIISRLITTKGEFVKSLGTEYGSYLKTFLHTDLASDILQAIPYALILFVLSFVAYSLLAGILSSMTTSIEDYSQLQMPLMIILLLGYYIAIVASMYENSIFIKITAYIPFISGIVAPVLLMLGQMSIFEVIISILILFITCGLLIRYGLRIYKVGILNYSSTKLWNKIFSSLKNKE